MVNVKRFQRLVGHMYSAHSHRMGCGKIARVIFEHRGETGVQAIQGKNSLKGRAFWFGVKACVLNAVDRVKQAREAARFKNALRVGFTGICIDNSPAGQRGKLCSKVWIFGKPREINIMHICQIGSRVNIMLTHQPRQRGAIGVPIVLTQPVGLGFANAKRLHDPSRHPHLDLIKQTVARWVKGVVQIEHPCGDVGKLLLHLALVASCRRRRNPWLDPKRQARLVSRGHSGEKSVQKDAYSLILEAIESGVYKPGDRLVESEMAERLGVSRTPVREALQRLETQSMLTRDGRSLIVASLDHNQLAELYTVRTELEGLAAKLAARHATDEEIHVLRSMVEDDRALLGGDPRLLSRANKRFHKQIHLASHNRFLVQQLDLVHRSMALMTNTSFAAEGRDGVAIAEHDQIVRAIEAHDGEAAYQALRGHISKAFETRLRVEAGELRSR